MFRSLVGVEGLNKLHRKIILGCTRLELTLGIKTFLLPICKSLLHHSGVQ